MSTRHVKPDLIRIKSCNISVAHNSHRLSLKYGQKLIYLLIKNPSWPILTPQKCFRMCVWSYFLFFISFGLGSESVPTFPSPKWTSLPSLLNQFDDLLSDQRISPSSRIIGCAEHKMGAEAIPAHIMRLLYPLDSWMLFYVVSMTTVWARPPDKNQPQLSSLHLKAL